MSLGERLNQLFKEKNVNPSSFSRLTGYPRMGSYNIITEKVEKPGIDLAIAILEAFPDVNIRWLLLGKGPIYLTPEQFNQISVTPDNNLLDKMIQLLEKRINELENEIKQIDPDTAKRLMIE